MTVNWREKFKFPFKDKRWWVKILISIVPIANLGYLLRILKDAKEGKEQVLPEWEGWEDLFKNGIMALIIWIVYLIPIAILNILGAAPGVGMLFNLLSVLAGIIIGPVVAIALCKYLETEQLKDAFKIQDIIEKLKVNIKDYLIVAVVFGILFALLGVICFASIFTLCLFPIIMVLLFYVAFYLKIIVIRIYGEIYRG